MYPVKVEAGTMRASYVPVPSLLYSSILTDPPLTSVT
jgi:hypothetical protein